MSFTFSAVVLADGVLSFIIVGCLRNVDKVLRARDLVLAFIMRRVDWLDMKVVWVIRLFSSE